MNKQVKKEKIFCWMLRNLTKECYLCCYKYRRRNLNVYTNIYSYERDFFLEGIPQSSLIIKNRANKARQVF